MTRKRLVVTLAILNIFIPFLGIPRGTRTFLIVVFSAVIAGAVYGLDNIIRRFFSSSPAHSPDAEKRSRASHSYPSTSNSNDHDAQTPYQSL